MVKHLFTQPRVQRFLIWLGVIGVPLLVYAWTLLPGIGYGDTAEFQRVAPTLGLAHVTGYPLYTLLGWFWTRLPLGQSAAWQMNLLSALLGASALGVFYHVGRLLGQRRLVALAMSLTFGFSLTFWLETTHAEVYALSVLLQICLIAALLGWRVAQVPLWVSALVLGLGLAHHRTILLLTPGAMFFVLLSRRPTLRELMPCVAALVLPCLLYVYVPLQAQPWEDPWQLLKHYLLADVAGDWLMPGQLWADGWARPVGIFKQMIWPAFSPVGFLLALPGIWRVIMRDRAVAILLLLSYGLYFAFCAAYYVPDLEVFLLPGHVIMALLGGEGIMAILNRWPQARAASPGLLGLPLFLLLSNLGTVHQHNSPAAEQHARTLMAQPFAPGALVILEPYLLEGPRYVQAVEGVRPDLEFRFSPDRAYIEDSLRRGRAVYVQKPVLELGLKHTLEGQIWRIQAEPLAAAAKTPVDARWQGGLRLVRYSLPTNQPRPGSTLALGLAWTTEQVLPTAYTTFIHIEDSAGKVWGQTDSPPTLAPTNQWPINTMQIELYAVTLDPQIPAGRYTIKVGWYDPATMQRLPTNAGGNSTSGADSLMLGEIEVGP